MCKGDLKFHPPRSFKCEQNHAVDLAKDNFLYLAKRNKKKGENAAADVAIRARREFFDAGGFHKPYDDIAKEIVMAIRGCPNFDLDFSGAHVLNAGCGEGRTLRSLRSALLKEPGGAHVTFWGTDPSKLSIKLAARRQLDAHFAVSSTSSLPFADGSMDVVACAFAPSPWEEICRVLRPGGAVVVARPGPEHLIELKGESSRREPKQFAAGLGERYERYLEVETYSSADARKLIEMSQLQSNLSSTVLAGLASGLLNVTVDVLTTTHRVWLGTGGYREKPGILY